jgi:hypothetical protein
LPQGDKAANVFNRALMLGFLLFNVGLVVGWGLTFSSNAVVHIFSQWAFFSFAQVTALLVILGTLGFGIWSRLNFDVRLEEYRKWCDFLSDLADNVLHRDKQTDLVVDASRTFC